MGINDLYQEVLGVICKVTGVGEHDMFGSNREECVDARSLLVRVLSGNGITEKEIVCLTGLSQQRVNRLKNNFKNRLCKWTVTNNLQSINNELTNNCFTNKQFVP